MEDLNFRRLKKDIYEALGFNADQYEVKHFKRRIQSRMRATKSADYGRYLEYLKHSTDERRKLMNALTINETEFFRNPEVYLAFQEKFLPELFKKKSKNQRIWSLGCATGEEPYSIAMTVAEVLGKDLQNIDVRIYATDIDVEALSVAKKGEYRDISKIPREFVERYMIKMPGGKFTFKREINEMIHFKKHDIFSDKPLKNIDVIFCRNTIIYFKKESKKELYHLFNNSLVMGGYLILGKAESFINHRDYGFDVLDRKNHIFKKIVDSKKPERSNVYGFR